MTDNRDTPAVRSSSNMGTTSDSRQADAVENTEDRPPAKPSPRLADKTGADSWDRSFDWVLANGALPALAVITIAVFAIHAHIFAGETAGDDLSFHFAESARLMDCIRGLDFDFWNPSANAGYASAYYYQVLPQLASALPAAIFGHHLFWFQLSVVLPLVAAPACAYKGMRLFGATPWQAVVAAFCVAFMNGASRWGAGSAGNFNVGLYTQTWALCALPIALGYAYQWMTHSKHLAAAIAWSAFVTLCHPFAGITFGIAVFAAWFAQLVLLPVDIALKEVAPSLRGKSDWLANRWDNPAPTSTFVWERLRVVFWQLWRGKVLAIGLVLAVAPVWLPLVIDAEGFGGFPHRVSDEVGPGFKVLGRWYANGEILDWLDPKAKPPLGMRIALLTWTLPLVVLFARGKFFRWLWMPALVFALLLGLGPRIGKIGEDLIPPVRFLGGMQTVLAMGIGAGVVIIGQRLWELAGTYADQLATALTWLYRTVIDGGVLAGVRWIRSKVSKRPPVPAKEPLSVSASSAAYGARTMLAALAAAAIVLVVVPGSRALGSRVRVLGDHASSRADELHIVNAILAKLPQGRKQVGPGAENHWWNMLTYAYQRVPSTLQMGGGGLQASPNYDFLWTQRDFVKNAWIFDAPYLVFMTSLGSKMPIGETIAKTVNYEIRRLPTPGLVSPVHVTGVLPPGYSHKELGHKKALEWIKGDQPMKDEVIAYHGWDAGNMDPPAGRALRSWRQDSPGSDPDIVGELEVEKTTTFTVRESWHPRWHAYIDDEEVPVRRVTPDFMAVDVPPGKHTLAVRFERPWWAHAAWLAWPLAALLAWFVLRRVERRSSPSADSLRSSRAA